jgi:hypothetical protein
MDLTGKVVHFSTADVYITDDQPLGNTHHIRGIRLGEMVQVTGRTVGDAHREPTPEERAAVVRMLDRMASIRQGSVVTVTRPRKPVERGIFVVTAVNDKSVSIVKLGGNPTGQYLRIPAGELSVTDVSTLRFGDADHA